MDDFIVLCEVVGAFPTGASGDAFVELQGSLEPTERVPDLIKFQHSGASASQQG